MRTPARFKGETSYRQSVDKKANCILPCMAQVGDGTAAGLAVPNRANFYWIQLYADTNRVTQCYCPFVLAIGDIIYVKRARDRNLSYYEFVEFIQTAGGGTTVPPVPAHNLLNTPAHGDTTTQAVSVGSLIHGSAAPASWTELVHPAAANRVLETSATNVQWATTTTGAAASSILRTDASSYIYPVSIGLNAAAVATNAVLAFPETADPGAGIANVGQLYCKDDGAGNTELYYMDEAGNVTALTPPAAGGNTLDQAYDQGGAGAGRTITADAGAVQINGAGGLGTQGDIVLDDGAGDSPQVQFVGGSNDDTARIFLDDVAAANQSDLVIRLAGAVVQAELQVQDSGGQILASFYGDAGLCLHAPGGLDSPFTVSDGLSTLTRINTEPACYITIGTAITNAIREALRIAHSPTAGVPAAGMGVRMTFELEDNSPANEDAAYIDAIWTNSADGTEESYLAFSVMTGGVAAAEMCRVDGLGILMAADKYVDGNFRLEDTSELTIAGGAVTATKSYHRIDTQGGAASDDLDTIAGGTTGDVLVLRAEDDARTVVVKHQTGNIWLNAGGLDISLRNTEDHITLVYDGSNWCHVTHGGARCLYDSGWVLSAAGQHTFTHNLGSVPVLITLMAADDNTGTNPVIMLIGTMIDLAANFYGFREDEFSTTVVRVFLHPAGYAYTSVGAKYYQRGTDYIRCLIWATE